MHQQKQMLQQIYNIVGDYLEWVASLHHWNLPLILLIQSNQWKEPMTEKHHTTLTSNVTNYTILKL